MDYCFNKGVAQNFPNLVVSARIKIVKIQLYLNPKCRYVYRIVKTVPQFCSYGTIRNIPWSFKAHTLCVKHLLPVIVSFAAAHSCGKKLTFLFIECKFRHFNDIILFVHAYSVTLGLRLRLGLL